MSYFKKLWCEIRGIFKAASFMFKMVSVNKRRTRAQLRYLESVADTLELEELFLDAGRDVWQCAHVINKDIPTKFINIAASLRTVWMNKEKRERMFDAILRDMELCGDNADQEGQNAAV